MKLKKILLAALLICFSTNAAASVIGNITSENTVGFGAGAVLHSNSLTDGEKNQHEFYVEYTPNTDSVPVILNGEQIYGRRTILEAAKYYDSLDMRPLLAVNADYFSYKTGIPMGHTITGGELTTKDTTGQNAIGFNEDGTAFVSWLEIQTTLTSDNGEMFIDCVNKWCQPGSEGAYLLTDYFAADTKTSGNYRYVIFSKTSGDFKIGSTVAFTVEEKFDTEYNIAIPDDKYILVMDINSGNKDKLAFMDSLNVGQQISIRNESVYDKELWSRAKNGMGSIGGRLLEGGNIYGDLEKGTAPRTAVGVKTDGTVVFYAVDGRQSGYSDGLSLQKLAARMKELGCMDAINLDGGGSTAIAGVYPGSDTFDVINKPSDGALRSCANYIFLQDMRSPTGVAASIKIKNSQNVNYLTGARVPIEVESMWDTNNFRMDTSGVSYEAVNSENTSAVIDGSTVVLSGNGTVTVNAKFQNITEPVFMNVYNFPDNIIVKDNFGKELNNMAFLVGESGVIQLNSSAYLNGYYLSGDASCFEYSVTGNIGTVEGGVFTANTATRGEGSIIVKAGEYIKKIGVVVYSNDNYFADISGHWSRDTVNRMYEDGLISGVELDGKRFYYPDNSMTRAEFSSIICNYLDIDPEQFANSKMEFSDAEAFAPWMVNYAKTMFQMGIINGIPSEYGIEFRPNDPITRAQAMTILGRVLPEEEDISELSFTDSWEIPEWAYAAASKLIQYGVVNGYEDNTIRPDRYVTRAEAAGMIYNAKMVGGRLS